MASRCESPGWLRDGVNGLADVPGQLGMPEQIHYGDGPVGVCAVWLSEACNVGIIPVVKPDVPALTRGRLS